MKRRHFIKLAGSSPLIMLAHGCARKKVAPSATVGDSAPRANVVSSGTTARVLVLLELKGGNDGLNTVIPYRDQEYARLRPQLGIKQDRVLTLSDEVGLHPSMESLMTSWKAKDMAIIQGVGYESPNRSHFKSIEIWETALSDDDTSEDGWLVDQLEGHIRTDQDMDAIAVGQQELGPLRGGMRTLTLEDPTRMAQVSRRLGRISERASANDSLAHILRVQSNLLGATERIEERLQAVPPLKHTYPRGEFGQHMEMATKLIVSELPVMVLKVTLGGFDTHAGQAGKQARLLGQLSAALSAMRANLIAHGAWEKTLVMTYSEFGRRPAQNGSKGTDHGTAAPQLVWGGGVRGGLYGKAPSLTNLANQDLIHHVDFRQVYATITRDWWGVPARGTLESHKPLDFLKGEM